MLRPPAPIHWGKDVELCARMENYGLRWVRELSAVGYHRLTLKEGLHRAWRSGADQIEPWKYGTKPWRSILFRIVARTLAMPIYYAFRGWSPHLPILFPTQPDLLGCISKGG